MMRYLVLSVSFVLVILLAISDPTLAQQKIAPPAANAASAAAARALLDKYCVTCHNARLKTANLTFDKMDLSHVADDGAVWEKAVRKLRGGMMPPPGAPRPT